MITITDYETLTQYYEAFGKGLIGVLVVESRGGLGKTSLAKKTLKGLEHGWISAHCTPLMLYKTAYFNRNLPLVFDDVDELLSSKVSVSLLKQLCESRREKTLSYYSTAPQTEDIPQSFRTSSPILILSNDIKQGNSKLKALMDRAHFIFFNPHNRAILEYVKEELTINKPAFEFIEAHIESAQELSVRSYIKICELYEVSSKVPGLNWQSQGLKLLKCLDKLEVLRDLIREYGTDKERLSFWQWSRASYYLYKKQLGESKVYR